jgi:predicted RNase H-like HicB family nuclease
MAMGAQTIRGSRQPGIGDSVGVRGDGTTASGFLIQEDVCMETAYELRIEIEELDDGSDYKYMGTSPDLPNLIVVGDSIEEVLALAPGVAQALIETMREHGQPLPPLVQVQQPWQTRVLVPA